MAGGKNNVYISKKEHFVNGNKVLSYSHMLDHTVPNTNTTEVFRLQEEHHFPPIPRPNMPTYSETPARAFTDVVPPNEMHYEKFGEEAAQIKLYYDKIYTWLQSPYITDSFTNQTIDGKPIKAHQIRSVYRKHVTNNLDESSEERQLLQRAMSNNKLTGTSLTRLDLYLDGILALNLTAPALTQEIKSARELIVQVAQIKELTQRIKGLHQLEDQVHHILLSIARIAAS